jgi:hypothetical protein
VGEWTCMMDVALHNIMVVVVDAVVVVGGDADV